MPGVKIVTDSTADVPAALVRELEIEVVPLSVNFGEEAYRAGIDLTNEQFYKLLPEHGLRADLSAAGAALRRDHLDPYLQPSQYGL